MWRALKWLVSGVVAVAIAGFAAFHLSPWPSVLLIRQAFDKGAVAAAEALEKHVPAGIESLMDIRYAEGDSDALLDLFRPANLAEPLPVVV